MSKNEDIKDNMDTEISPDIKNREFNKLRKLEKRKSKVSLAW